MNQFPSPGKGKPTNNPASGFFQPENPLAELAVPRSYDPRNYSFSVILYSCVTPPGDKDSNGSELGDPKDLWTSYREAMQKGDTSTMRVLRENIIATHFHRVVWHAENLHKTLPEKIDLNDLISCGVLGMIDAVDRFHPERGVQFATFASKRIKGAMLDYLRSEDWAPRAARNNARKLRTTSERLTAELRRDPLRIELEHRLGSEFEDAPSNIDAWSARSMNSLHEQGVAQESDYPALQAINLLLDPSANTSTADLVKRDLRNRLLRLLTPRERRVVDYHYIGNSTFQEIGDLLGLSKMRACQIHGEAISKIQRFLQNRPDLVEDLQEDS